MQQRVVNQNFIKTIFTEIIFAEARIYKYIHINHKLNIVNIKYYNFYSIFDTTEFCRGKSICGCESKSLDNTRTTPCPTVPPSEAVNAYMSQHGSNC
jgi:hypothetical protein